MVANRDHLFSYKFMIKPVFKNVHNEETLIFSTPEGVSVTIHPGEFVIGEYFVHLVKRGTFEIVEVDISKIPISHIKYEQK